MFRYQPFESIVDDPGLRIILVQGVPSPWAQAAKTVFEIKGLDYSAAAWIPFEDNEPICKWGSVNSAPIVAWRDEPPINGWLDILLLAERLGPFPALLPSDMDLRATVIGLSNAICGRDGLLWNRRLQMVRPAFAADSAPSPLKKFGLKFGYTDEDADAAGGKIAACLTDLASQLRRQHKAGHAYFIGDQLSAADIYWAAAANFIAPLPDRQCPMSAGTRSTLTAADPIVVGALDPILLQHRDQIFRMYFRDPMEF